MTVKRYWLGLASLVLMLSVTVYGWLPSASGFDLFKTKPNRGIFIYKIEKDVQVKKAGSDTWQTAEKKMQVELGDSLKTGPKSFATLKMCYPGTNSFQLYQNTEIIVAELVEGKKPPLKKVNIRTLKGGTWVKLKGVKSKDFKFNVSTPNTVAAVSGTSLAVIVYSDAETYFCACDGEIDVGLPGKSVVLTRSNGTTVKGGAAPTAPVNDKYILKKNQYRQDPRYGWCIHCHDQLRQNQNADEGGGGGC